MVLLIPFELLLTVKSLYLVYDKTFTVWLSLSSILLWKPSHAKRVI